MEKMNRKERRAYEREKRKFEKRMNKVKQDPLYKVMKEIDDSLRGSGTDVGMMKGMCLAYEPHPEPIQIMFLAKNQNYFDERAHHKFVPSFCYEQELDGTFSKVVANGIDLTTEISNLERSTNLDFFPEKLSRNSLNMELIKVFNSVYESQGGRAMDVIHLIFTDLSADEIIRQGKEMETHFKETYKGLRNVCIKAILPQEKMGA